MLHIPLLRRGRPYQSLDVAKAPHYATGEPFVEISHANVGLIRRDLLEQEAMRASLISTITNLSCGQWLATMGMVEPPT